MKYDEPTVNQCICSAGYLNWECPYIDPEWKNRYQQAHKKLLKREVYLEDEI